MAVTSKELRSKPSSGRIWLPGWQSLTGAFWLITVILAIVATYLIVDRLVTWGHIRLDDLRYGRPRTTHLEGFVGHDPGGRPSHFIALNLQRQVIVLELVSGDPAQVRSFPGPYLFGANEALTPVDISLSDVDSDGLNDLLVNARNEQVIYLNRDGTFRLPTPEEQALLLQE